MEITKDKITEIFCIIDDFCKEYDKEISKMAIPEPDGRKHRKRKWAMSRSEIMAILICFHFNTFRNFKPEFGIRNTFKKLVISIIFSIFVVENQYIINKEYYHYGDYQRQNYRNFLYYR